MDSLFANYASSDEDGEAEEVSRAIPHPKISSLSNALPPPKSSSFFSSLPPPRISNSSSTSSSSLFTSLPPPKSQLPNHYLNDYEREDDGGEPPNPRQSSSIFSTLPPPKTSSSSTFSSLPAPKSLSGNSSNKPSSDPKRVVHFTLPLNPSMLKSLDPDDDEEEKGRKVRKDASSSSIPKSLSSMLPAPKHSLCIAPAQSLGGSRRSSLQTDDSSANCPQGLKTEHKVGSFANYSEYGAEQGMAVGYEACGSYSAEQGVSDHQNSKNDDGNWSSGVVNSAAVSSADATYASIPARIGWEQDNANSFGYGSYMDSWSNVSSGATTSEIPDIVRIAGKRGRTDIPTEIVEVKQDELMKNRPREDQIKSTGIAFGPAYQAAPSGKGKPSKLHKRKHQIGSLYYDLKQKEMELAERRSKGLLTKAETQAKYGW